MKIIMPEYLKTQLTMLDEIIKISLDHWVVCALMCQASEDLEEVGIRKKDVLKIMREAKETKEAKEAKEVNVKPSNAEPETSLTSCIAEALYNLQDQIKKGRLSVGALTNRFNDGIAEQFHLSPQAIGRELSAMGIKRKKSGGKMQILYDLKTFQKIWRRFSIGKLPNVKDKLKKVT